MSHWSSQWPEEEVSPILGHAYALSLREVQGKEAERGTCTARGRGRRLSVRKYIIRFANSNS